MPQKKPWLVLSAFALTAGLSQLLWLNFAPLITLIAKKYAVTEDTAGLLLLVFPLVYVLLSLPAGALIDKKGYRYATCLGTFIMMIFSCLRIYEQSFAVLLIAQIGIAIAQPFVVNSISKLVLDHFEREQGAIATGIGTMGMFIGMAIGLAATPALVDGMGFRAAMIFFALVSIICFVLVFAFVRETGAEIIGGDAAVPIKAVFSFFKERQLVLLFTLSFLGLGFFNGLTTWIELILAPLGINSVQAGVIGAVLIVGGILGAVVIPALSDFFRRRKVFVVGSIAFALITVFPLCRTGNYHLLLLLAAAQGFFFLPAFSLLLEMCAEWAGEARAGSATAILMLLGNAGGVVVIIAMEAVSKTGPPPDFGPGVAILFALLAVALFVSFVLKESHPRRSKVEIK